MIEEILKLQKLNSEIDLLRSDAQVFPDRLSEVQKIFDTKKRKYEEGKTRILALKAELGDFQNTLSLEEQRLTKSRKKVNDLSKSYEFQAMKKEIEATERSNAELSIKITAKSAEVEKAVADFSQVETEFKTAEEALTAVRSEVEVKIGEFDGVLNQKLNEVKQLETHCDPQILSKYRLIRTRKHQDAIVGVVSGACQGCFMNIPPQMANGMMKHREKIETCPNCQRLIFWHEEK